MNEKIKAPILSNWNSYNLVDSEEEMQKVLNILEAHGESLNSLHDVSFNGRGLFCEILFNSNPESDREVVSTLYEYNVFYPTLEQMQADLKELAEDCSIPLEELMGDEDIRKTSDGYVRVLHY